MIRLVASRASIGDLLPSWASSHRLRKLLLVDGPDSSSISAARSLDSVAVETAATLRRPSSSVRQLRMNRCLNVVLAPRSACLAASQCQVSPPKISRLCHRSRVVDLNPNLSAHADLWRPCLRYTRQLRPSTRRAPVRPFQVLCLPIPRFQRCRRSPRTPWSIPVEPRQRPCCKPAVCFRRFRRRPQQHLR